MTEKFDATAESKRLVAMLQQKKLPLVEERAALHAQAKALKAQHEKDLAALRKKIFAVQNKAKDVDVQLRNADGLKNLRGPLAEKVAGEINDALGGK